METESTSKRPALEFPLRWQYRIVAAADCPEPAAAIEAALTRTGVRVIATGAPQASSGGKYRSYHVTVEFADEAQMKAADAALAAIDGIKFVM